MKGTLLGAMMGAALLGSGIGAMYKAPHFPAEGSFDQRAIRKARKSSRAKGKKRRRN